MTDGPTSGPARWRCCAVSDGWVAFQNAIGWDATTRTSSSAVRVLTSTDGLDWRVTGEPILAPTGSGWAATHVYAVDVRDTPTGIRLYANGRNAAHWTRGREHVGLATPDRSVRPADGLSLRRGAAARSPTAPRPRGS